MLHGRGSPRAHTSAALFMQAAWLSQMGLLGLALAIGRVLERNHVNWMSEAGGALIVGIVVGLVVTLAKNLSYNYTVLFQFNVRFCKWQHRGHSTVAVHCAVVLNMCWQCTCTLGVRRIA